MKFLVRAAACILGIAPAAFAFAAPQMTVGAHWQKHDINFAYMGFTSYYSCDGLEGKLKLLLRLAGARPDAKVRVACTSLSGRPERSSMARLTFHALVPDAHGAAAGVWRDVAWRVGSPHDLEGGDCELVEQFAQRILPALATRKVENHMNCVPHQANPWGIDLRFERAHAGAETEIGRQRARPEVPGVFVPPRSLRARDHGGNLPRLQSAQGKP